MDTHNSGATLVASMGDFLMRSLTSVLIPRQLQGGSGPEPAATHESGTTASQRALATDWADTKQVRPLEPSRTSPTAGDVDTHVSALLVASKVLRFLLPANSPLRLERLDPA